MAETEYLLDFSKRLGYVNERGYKKIENLGNEMAKLLWKFYKKISI